jgi:hypothetical protein
VLFSALLGLNLPIALNATSARARNGLVMRWS